MVTVPRLTDQRVQERPLPVTQTPTQVDPSNIGAGQAAQQVFDVAAQSVGPVGEIADERLEQANNLWFLEAENELSTRQLEIENQVKSRKGRDAFGAKEEADEEFRNAVAEIQKRTNNDTQKLGLQSISSKRGQSLDRFVNGHTNNEIENVQIQENQAYRVNLTNSAMNHYGDPVSFSEDKTRFEAVVEDEIERRGFGDETAKAFRVDQLSEFNTSVIEQMLQNEDNSMAEAYFDAHEDELTPEARNAIKPALEEAGFRVSVQKQSDFILETTDDWDERFEMAKREQDPEKRKAIEQTLRTEFNLERQLESEANDDIMLSATNIVDANLGVHPRSVVPADEWSKLTVQQRNALINFSGVNTPGQAPATDMDKYVKFYNMTSKERGSLPLHKVQELLLYFDKSRQATAEKLWLADQKGVQNGTLVDEPASPQAVAQRTYLQLNSIDSLDSLNDKRKYNLFLDRFERDLKDFKTENDKDPTQFQTKEIVSSILGEEFRETASESRTTFKEATSGQIETGGLAFRRTKDGQERVFGMTSKEVEAIQNRLSSQGVLAKESSEYSQLVRRIGLAARQKDSFKVNELIRAYKRDNK